MLDMDVMSAMLTKALKNRISFLRSIKRIYKRVSPAGEIIFLNINDKECSFHNELVGWERL
jgi:hypothetical protein